MKCRNSPTLLGRGQTSTHDKEAGVKWKNIDIGAAYYCIMGTFTEWLPLFKNGEIQQRDHRCGRAAGGYIDSEIADLAFRIADSGSAASAMTFA